MTNDKSSNVTQPADGPEPGATPEAVALHGDAARAEQHPQAEAVVDLPAGTRIATGDDEDDENE